MFFRPFKPPIRAIDIKNEKRETCSVYLIRASGNAPFKPPIRAIDIKNEKRETCSVYLIRASGNALQG